MRFYIHIFFLYLFLFKKNQRLLYCQPMCVCLILSNSWMLLHSEESTVNFSYQSLWISCLGLTQFEATAEKDSVVLVVQSCPTVCDPMDCSLPGSSLHGILQVRILEWKKKKKNTGVDFHSLLQRIFLTQGLNPGLLCCRQPLYCLSYREDNSKKR